MNSPFPEPADPDMHWGMSVRRQKHERGFLYPVFEWDLYLGRSGFLGTVRLSSAQKYFITLEDFSDSGEGENSYKTVDALLTKLDEYGWGEPPHIDEAYSILNQWYRRINEIRGANPRGVGPKAMGQLFDELFASWQKIVEKGFPRPGTENDRNAAGAGWIMRVPSQIRHDGLSYPMFEWLCLDEEHETQFHLQLYSWEGFFGFTDKLRISAVQLNSIEEVLNQLGKYRLEKPPCLEEAFQYLLDTMRQWVEDMQVRRPDGLHVSQDTLDLLRQKWISCMQGQRPPSDPAVEAQREFWNKELEGINIDI